MGFIYDSDVYNDEIPYYVRVGGKSHLVVPYTSDCNDFHYWTGKFNTSESFFQYLKDSFDVLYSEGAKNPKMMSVGTHVRISSKPGQDRRAGKIHQTRKVFSQSVVCKERRDCEMVAEELSS